MNTNLNQGSAKIYQFPAGGRAALGARRYAEAKTVPDLPTASRVSAGAWYHEAAIVEAELQDEH